MGALVGLGFGLGLLLVGWALAEPAGGAWPAPARRVAGWAERWLASAGLPRLAPSAFLGACAGAPAPVWVTVLGVSRSVSIATAFAVLAAYAPVAWVRARRARRAGRLAEAWPDVVDDLRSAVRAGLALPEALAELATRGPEELRPAFAEFAADHRSRGRFLESLDVLKDRLADPVGDRVVEALRVAREVGGSDLGGLLRTLSDLLRDDARTRAELVSRQAWTVNGARLAVAAPWLVLAAMATRPQAVRAYDTSAGVVVLFGGLLASAAAYRVMRRIGRLPTEPRVLA